LTTTHAGDVIQAGKPSEAAASHGRRTVVGTLQLLGVHLLLLPAGFATTVFLTRQLGPELFGYFSVAAAIVTWVASNTTKLFSSTAVKFIAEVEDWEPTASALIQAQLLVSLGATAILVIAAPTLAGWLSSPELTPYLRLFALGIPFYALARIHRSMLIGRGAFGRVPWLTAAYGIGRLILIFVLVELGFSLTGAVLGTVGASVAQLIVARIFVHPRILQHARLPKRLLAGYALPLFFYTLAMTLLSRLGLMAVQALAGAEAAAGFYASAGSLLIPAGLFVVSFSPLFLSTLTQMLRDDQAGAARSMITQTIRLELCLVPFVAAVAGSASQIVSLVYGPEFLPAGPLLAFLVFAAPANIMTSVNTSALTALGRPGWTFALAGPLLPLALVAHLALVPRFGAVGAAATTATLAWLGAVATTLAVYRLSGAYPAPATILRVILTASIAYGLSSAWQARGASLIVELSGLAAVIVACLILLGELTGRDRAFLGLLVRPGAGSLALSSHTSDVNG
jgi:O-antigen/teichoic acid export membrane protein